MFFRFTALMQRVRRFCVSDCGAGKCWRSSVAFRAAWAGWKRVRRIATAIAATVVEPSGFRSGREFAAWLGLVPRQSSTGGKHRLGGISKRGNQYLRRLLINGASANLLRSKATNADPGVIRLRQRRPSLVVAVALANKTARIAWAVMHRHENYQRVAAAA
jgi:transposase